MHIWIASRGGLITAFDVATRDVLASVDVGHRVTAMARDGERLVAAGEHRVTTFTGLDADDTETTSLPGTATSVVATGGGTVVLCAGRRPVLVWPESGRQVRVGHQAQALAHGHGCLWLVRQSRPGVLERRDEADGALRAEIEVHRDPQVVVCGRRWIWVATDGPGGIDRVDPATGTLEGTVETDRQPAALAEAHGGVWVVHGSVPRVTRIDPDELIVAATIRVGAGGFGIGTGGGDLWLTQTLASKVCIVDPGRGGVRARFDWDEPFAIC